MTSHGQCPRGGGACECPRVGAFFKLMTGTRAMSKGGGACECPRVGAFFKLMTSRGQCPRGGGAPGVPPIQVQTPPHLAGWLRACCSTGQESPTPIKATVTIVYRAKGGSVCDRITLAYF